MSCSKHMFQLATACNPPSCRYCAHCRAFACVESKPALVFHFPSPNTGWLSAALSQHLQGTVPSPGHSSLGKAALKETLQKTLISHPDSMGSFSSCAMCVKAASPGRCLITSLPC